MSPNKSPMISAQKEFLSDGPISQIADELARLKKTLRDISSGSVGGGAGNIAHGQIIWTSSGANLSSTGLQPLKIRLPYVGGGAVVEEIYVQLGTAPGSSALQIAIYKNGNNLLTGTTYISVGVGDTNASRTTGFLSSGSIAKDDYFQVNIIQGDATAADLVLHMRYYWGLGTL